MSRTLRLVKRLALPGLLAGTLLLAAQVVFATPPVASFTADITAGAPGCGSVTFTSTSTDAETDIDTITWDFGDGSSGSGSTVTHQYATPGPFQVSMTATDLDTAGDGVESNTATQQVQIPNTAPTAGFTPTYNATTGATDFAATATDPNGAITNYAWDFGDGGTGTGPAVSHNYADHDPHNASLTLTDNCGAQSAAAVQQITPGNTLPAIGTGPAATVGGAAVTVVNPGVAVNFAAAATDVNGDAVTYSWDLNGDNVFGDAVGATAVRTYAATDANPDVRVQVSDGVGTVTSAPLAIRVNKAPVVALVNDPESPQVGETVNFNAGLSHDADLSPGALTYAWDLDGDGAYDDGTGTTASHQFNTVGSSTIGVQVTDGDNLTSTLTKAIVVQKTRPRASLRYAPANPVPGQTVTLTSTSTKSPSVGSPAITLTQWDFDYLATGAFGPMASGLAATTSFATAGVHTVAVRVTDGSGGTDIAYLPVVVNAKPTADFTVQPGKPVEGRAVTFTSISRDSDGPIVKQEWDLDNDGRYDDGSKVVASTRKLRKGTRKVGLRVTDSKGATATITKRIKVKAKPLTDPPEVISSLGYARRAWGLQVVALTASVPARTTVKVTCQGHGCPHGKFVRHSKKKAAELRFSGFHGLLRAGAKITVISSRKGSLAEYFTWSVRGNYQGPGKHKRCKAPGSKKFRSCR